MKNEFFFILMTASLFAFTYPINRQEQWVAPVEAKELKNPVPKSKRTSSAYAGKKIFDAKCNICHGDKGKGDGFGAPRIGPKPADFTTKTVREQEDGEIFWKISNGKGFMPKWEANLSEEERWNLVNYVRTFK